ncbi:putative membrane protein YfcA [Burkholderia ambifaria]|nr:sulfite exporter TauE/SafE family protein [Burkholderia ambifaria]MDR6498171.1 putative membrane protein YfcA [Burkholderia ambifaria]
MMLNIAQIIELVAVLFITGAIKGSIGFGMAPLAVPLLSPVIGVKSAVALLNMPVLISSIQLCIMQKSFILPLKKYWKLIAFQGIGVMLGTSFLTIADAKLVSLALGLCILFFIFIPFIQRMAPKIHMPPLYSEPIVGGVGGVLGGATSIFGPFIAAYLSGRENTKDGVAKAINVSILIGSLIAAILFHENGQLEFIGIEASVLSFIPVGLGVWAGSKFRDHVSDKLYLIAIKILLAAISIALIAEYFLQYLA